MVIGSWDHVLQLNEQGVSLLINERNSEAVGIFTMCIQLDARFPLLFYNRAVGLNKLGRYEEALDDVHQFISLTKTDPALPETPYGYNLAADILLNLKRYEEAERYYTMSIDVYPLPVMFYGRGLTRCLLGDMARGYEDLREAAVLGYPEAKEIMTRMTAATNGRQQTVAAVRP